MTGLDRETLELALESIRDFAKQKLAPESLLEWDARDEMPLALVREMCGPGLGIQLLFLPEACGGMGGGAFDVYRCCEALARIDLGVATGLLATFLGSDPIRVGGTPEQKSHWLRRIAEEGLLLAYGATEPEAGSDLAALRTTAAPIVEDGRITGYRLSGRKQWISNGGVADVATVLANAPGGPSWFIVERETPGFGHERPEDKHGIRLSNTAALVLDDVVVPADHLVGGVEGLGLQQALAVFGYTRLMVAAFGLGAGWAALDVAIPYSTQRVQAGGPLSQKQGYTHKLIVPHAARLEAARAHIEETAAALDGLAEPEGHFVTEGAIAKYLASEAGNRAADAAIQALGGYGYTREYHVEKIRRDVRITTIYEGTSEIMEITISRDRWQQHLKTRGRHYHESARALEALEGDDPGCGAGIAALAHHALAEAMERARTARLTRNQHVLMRLGELAATAEGAAAFARRAAAAAAGRLPEKADARFAPEALAALARVYAREAALEVATGALRWIGGSDGLAQSDAAAFAAALGLEAIQRAQTGNLADMDRSADALYAREPQRTG
jgi:alkylation response protein AidB-like acyl-CoA dehydrogenase